MDKQTLIDHLNEDLASEFGAIIQYITYAAKALSLIHISEPTRPY